MTRALIFTFIAVVWGIALALKAANALRTGEPYVFSMWDGGLWRVGKQLTPGGTKIKIVVGVTMSGVAAAMLLGLLPATIAFVLVIGAVVLSIVSDAMSASTP